MEEIYKLAYTGEEIDERLARVDEKQDVINDLANIRSGAEDGAEALAKVEALAEVASSGDYNDLENKPTIPTKASDLTNDSDFATTQYVDNGLDAMGEAIDAKQDALVSGTNIKTINGVSVLGAGNIEIQGGGGFTPTPDQESALNSGITAAKVSQYDGYATSKADKSSVYTKSEVDGALAGKQDVINDLATIRSGASAGASAVQPATLGNYYNKTEIDAKIGDIETILASI